MEPLTLGILSIALLLALIFSGVHIAIAMGVVGFAGLVFIMNFSAALSVTAISFYVTGSAYSFIVLPLFIIMGEFAAASGIMVGAYRFAATWLSSLRGGLYLVTTFACALFAGCTGSSAATAIAVGKSVLPEMQRLKYNRSLSLGCVAVCGTLGVMIPPSVAFVIYAIATEESIGRLLLAGIMPGILTAIMYMVGTSILVRIKPELAPPTDRHTWSECFRSVPGVLGVFLLFSIVMGGIYTGFFTPNEAAAWGAFAAMLLVIRKKGQFLAITKQAALETIATSAMIFLLLMTATIFTKFLTLAGFVDAMSKVVLESGFNPYVILMLFIVICIILGMFLNAGSVIILIAPLAHKALVPLGFDGIWLGVIMVKMFELAVITPPVALNLYVTQTLIPESTIGEVIHGTIPYLVMECVSIFILILFPQISTWLPSIAYGK